MEVLGETWPEVLQEHPVSRLLSSAIIVRNVFINSIDEKVEYI